MKYFLDTEFYENGRTIKLISIGVVAEDGRTFYIETMNSAHLATATPWLKENVLPYLGKSKALCSGIGAKLLNWIGNDDKVEFWAYYADYDWIAFCQLFGTMLDLPSQFPKYCNDVKQLARHKGNPDLSIIAETKAHHALADAEWTKRAYEYLVTSPYVD